ncbi:MAG: ABC transporter ATP-binding protein [Oscillospiraceae bacterium]|nr:ABC transporter ATP-binding protein [Oscillospiraceae bacterium]
MLEYVRPYWKQVIVCLVLALVLTALDLYRPILIGQAIDDNIEGYDYPYVYSAGENSVSYKGESLVKLTKETFETDSRDDYAVTVLYEDAYYFFTHLTHADCAAVLEAADEIDAMTLSDGTLTVPAGGKSFSGALLTNDEMSALRRTDLEGLYRIAVIYGIVLIVYAVAGITNRWMLETLGQNIVYTIRNELFSHIHSLPLRYFDTNPVGRIVTRVTNDVESINSMYTQIIVRLFENFVLIVGYAVVMINIDWKLALLSFAFLPVIFGITIWCRTESRKIYRVVRTKISALNTFLSENISGMKLIQIFAREKEKAEEFRGRTTDLYKTQMKELLLVWIFRPLIFLVANAALAVILYRSGVSVLSGTLTLGTMYIFINYIRSFFEPIQELADQFATLQNALASAEKIFTVLDEENTIREKENPTSLGTVRGKIEFRHVWFAYEGEEYVLRDVSFVINPGEKVAFVGATGAGKSSILNLIGRYYDIQQGQILIDDVDIRELSTREIRHAIGQVQQDVFVFTGDIKSNIRLLDDSITDEQVEQSSVAVNADRFIEKLPGRYDEPVTERGATLSAGQRQLLSFARTLAYDPKILVMDEATANIDTETEELIQDALKTLMEGRTTIMVAHRLSTIQHADNILVMHKGKIRESGTHQELLEKNGIYKKLYDIQQ